MIHIQHIADPKAGITPFFNESTSGADIKAEVLSAAPNGIVVVKHYADAFFETNLEEVLSSFRHRRDTRMWHDEPKLCYTYSYI